MKVICDIPDDVYTRLFDNGVEVSSVKDIIEISRAIRNGVVAPNDAQIGFFTTVNRDGIIATLDLLEGEEIHNE